MHLAFGATNPPMIFHPGEVALVFAFDDKLAIEVFNLDHHEWLYDKLFQLTHHAARSCAERGDEARVGDTWLEGSLAVRPEKAQACTVYCAEVKPGVEPLHGDKEADNAREACKTLGHARRLLLFHFRIRFLELLELQSCMLADPRVSGHLDGGRPLLRIDDQKDGDEVLSTLADVFPVFLGEGKQPVLNLPEEVGSVLGIEWGSATEHNVEDDTQGPHVAHMRVLRARNHLWGKIQGRTAC
mmetsp:Transcript_1308/g.2483  ORF Transcript_1308/g.2483 Transcript_1308/m.2483 type:complete len:242 (-) Transcript_1308:1563-2288(-)